MCIVRRTQYHRVKPGFNLILKLGVPRTNLKPEETINSDLNLRPVFKFIKIYFKM